MPNLTWGVEDLEVTSEYIRGLKDAYRTVIAIINDNLQLGANDVKVIVERQLWLEENN